jgi:hypothetical protein
MPPGHHAAALPSLALGSVGGVTVTRDFKSKRPKISAAVMLSEALVVRPSPSTEANSSRFCRRTKSVHHQGEIHNGVLARRLHKADHHVTLIRALIMTAVFGADLFLADI